MSAAAQSSGETEALRVAVGDWQALAEPASRIRAQVFVQEQGIAADLERDPRDAACTHCVVYAGDLPVATGRLLPDGHVGRMAVLAPYRGQGHGRRVLQALIEAARAQGRPELVLHAQATAVGFYAREGFEAEGNPFQEAGLLHLRMRQRLAEAAGAPLPGDPALVLVSDWLETMADGLGLRQQAWQCADAATAPAPRGVYLLHGLGEHVGRYDALARWFCERGWRVRGHDHAGHGRSGGRRGTLASERQLVDHARRLIERFADELGTAPLLLGHSLGGALAAQLVVCEGVPVQGLVLSSPALETGIGAGQRALTGLLRRLAPSLTLGNGLDPQFLSHDPAVVRAYMEDPLVHDRVSARLVHWLLSAGAQARARAGSLRVPALLLFAGADRLVDPEGSRAFARAAPTARLAIHEYPELYHELFNEHEPGRRTVLADLDRWLETALPARG